MKIEEIMVHIT